MTLRDHFITMSRYHQWATRKLLERIKLIPNAEYKKDCGLYFRSIHGTLNHLLVADLIWISRFNNESSQKITLDAEIEENLEELIKRLTQATFCWESFIMKTSDDKFSDDAVINYKTSNGKYTSSPFASTLDHVFNHGTHHRGQITAAITTMGYACPEIDLIYMVRHSISDKA
ncbi:MAG: DinB family protein [Acidithiobacillus ferrivorans]